MLTSKQIATALHVSEQTVREYARAGMIPFVTTPGGHRRYDLDDVQHALRIDKPRRIAPLSHGEGIRLAAASDRPPIKRVRGWRPTITRAMIGEANETTERQEQIRIPFIGIPGTSRYVLGQGTRA